MHKSTRGIIKTIFLSLLITIVNDSSGQSKIDKLDALINAYTEYGEFKAMLEV